ncbi:hypothetical protein L210DRAFT_831778, partial [Boletus edulis BED1]
ITLQHTHLTRNLGVLYPEIRDEIVLMSWISEETVRLLLKRSSNTVFIGLPLRRDPDWIDLNVRTTVDALKGDITVALFTKFM